jgi:hypothetical protein
MYLVEDCSNWMEIYPDVSEEIQMDLPPEKVSRVRMSVYIDADHAHDLITRGSITGTLVTPSNTSIRLRSKRQKTVETSAYSSELVASRIATELILEIRYILRSLGVALDGTELML